MYGILGFQTFATNRRRSTFYMNWIYLENITTFTHSTAHHHHHQLLWGAFDIVGPKLIIRGHGINLWNTNIFRHSDPKWILASDRKIRHISRSCTNFDHVVTLSSIRFLLTLIFQRYLRQPTAWWSVGCPRYALLATRSSPILSTCHSHWSRQILSLRL